MKLLTSILPLSGLLLATVGLLGCANPQTQPQPEPLPTEQAGPASTNSDSAATGDATLPAEQPGWAAILGETSAPAGWQVSPCINPTLLCVYENGEIIGTVELFVEPVEGSNFGTQLAESGGDQARALEAWVADHYNTIESDRKIGAPELKFTTEAPEPAAVGSLPGLRYGFTTTHANGNLADRTRGYVATDGTTLYVIVTGVINGDPTGSFSNIEAAQQFEPYLAEIVAGLTL